MTDMNTKVAALRSRLEDAWNCLIKAAAQVRPAYHQVFGIPDYQRYLLHMAEHHPEQTPLSRREFFARAIERKYCRSGAKCC
jgi:uncharacterized short protein YbdD (DUF466 family)